MKVTLSHSIKKELKKLDKKDVRASCKQYKVY